MAKQMPGRSDGGAADTAQGARPARPSEQDGAEPISPADGSATREPADKAEPEKARAEIAAGDVADDLADFA